MLAGKLSPSPSVSLLFTFPVLQFVGYPVSISLSVPQSFGLAIFSVSVLQSFSLTVSISRSEPLRLPTSQFLGLKFHTWAILGITKGKWGTHRG